MEYIDVLATPPGTEPDLELDFLTPTQTLY